MSHSPIERLRAPSHMQARLDEVGGLNRYGGSNFRLAWAQTETRREGGLWEAYGEQFQGYRDVLLGDGNPHWMLLQWCDAGKCVDLPHLPPQSGTAFYAETKCPTTGLAMLGEYPYRGSYQIALQLSAKWMVNGKLQVVGFPLSTEVIEMMVPVIRASMRVSIEAKLRAMKEEREKDEQYYATQVEDAYLSARRKPTLAATAWLEDKQRSIERHWNAALVAKFHRDRFFQSKQQVH